MVVLEWIGGYGSAAVLTQLVFLSEQSVSRMLRLRLQTGNLNQPQVF
jgi:hypothetical protein